MLQIVESLKIIIQTYLEASVTIVIFHSTSHWCYYSLVYFLLKKRYYNGLLCGQHETFFAVLKRTSLYLFEQFLPDLRDFSESADYEREYVQKSF